MTDREKVISNLQGVYEYLRNTAKMGEWVSDALALLKEQEAVEPLTIDDAVSEIIDKHYKRLKKQEAVVHPEPSCKMTYITNCCCDLCGVQLICEDNFCRCCGKRIEWEGR